MSYWLGFGAYISQSLRGELVYGNYTGLSYADKVNWEGIPPDGTATPTTIHTTSSISGGDIENYMVMLAAYYDFFGFNLGKFSVTPFLGFGVGFAYNILEDVTIATDKNYKFTYGGNTEQNTAWKIGGGAAFKLSKTMMFELTYNMVNLGTIQTSKYLIQDLGSGNLQTHEITPHQTDMKINEFAASLRFSF